MEKLKPATLLKMRLFRGYFWLNLFHLYDFKPAVSYKCKSKHKKFSLICIGVTTFSHTGYAINFRHQRPEVFYKKSWSRKFKNINRKTPVLESLFNKVADLQICNFIKKRLKHRCFPVNTAKFLRTHIS